MLALVSGFWLSEEGSEEEEEGEESLEQEMLDELREPVSLEPPPAPRVPHHSAKR